MAKPPLSAIMKKAASYRKVGETRKRALELAWDDSIQKYWKKHKKLPSWAEGYYFPSRKRKPVRRKKK